MNILTYGIFCEDAQMKYFTSLVIPMICYSIYPKLNILKDKEFDNLKVPNGKTDLQKKYIDALKFGLIICNLDLVIVGYDCDCDTKYKYAHNIQYDKSVEKIQNELLDYSKKSIVMIPVQAIEHWIMYFKYYKYKTKKNLKFESYTRPEAKREIYKQRSATINDRNKAIREVMYDNAALQKVVENSFSFRHFAIQVNHALKQFDGNIPIIYSKHDEEANTTNEKPTSSSIIETQTKY